jgi:hypothetical protein
MFLKELFKLMGVLVGGLVSVWEKLARKVSKRVMDDLFIFITIAVVEMIVWFTVVLSIYLIYAMYVFGLQ